MGEQVRPREGEGRGTAPVSVVIPCYRCSATIERAIRSVAGQSLRPAELILVDDASGDGTVAVLQELAGRHGGWVRVLSHPVNRGPGDARNTGWEAAGQPYIAFLDADDSWHPEKIRCQYRWMASHPHVAVTGHRCEERTDNGPPPPLASQGQAFSVDRRSVLVSAPFSTPSVMLRREIPFRFQPGKRYAEDYLLWMQIVLDGRAVVFIDEVLAWYHKPPFGAGGLSGRLWAMERGELAAYGRLHRERRITLLTRLGLSCYSLAKFFRRIVVVALRTVSS